MRACGRMVGCGQLARWHMHIYRQSLGSWHFPLPSTLVSMGYSGAGVGKNNPAMQAIHDTGPIPCGMWEITGPPFDTTEHGPDVLRLNPAPGTNTFGRSGFLVHGDSILHPGMASEGCIIMPHDIRLKIWASGDYDLQVIP